MGSHEEAQDLLERCKRSYDSATREYERANTALFCARRNYDDALGAYIELLKAGPTQETAPEQKTTLKWCASCPTPIQCYERQQCDSGRCT